MPMRFAALVLLSFCAIAQQIHGQNAPTASTLTLNSGVTPANLTCTVGGSPKTGAPVPTGTVTFTDLTENQTLGTATLAGPAAYWLQPLAALTPSVPLAGLDTGIVTGDFNGDGISDIAFIYQAQTTREHMVAVMLGNGDGAFQAPSTVDLGFAPSGAHNAPLDGFMPPIVADVNGDGKPDLIIAYHPGGDLLYNAHVDVLLNKGDGTFQAPIAETFPGIGGAELFTAGDFNGDGHVNLALSTVQEHADNLWILNGDGSGNFTPQKTPISHEWFNELGVADLRKDGKLDIIGELAQTGFLQILLGNGDGTFANPQVIPAYGQLFQMGDFNEDGFPDIAWECGLCKGSPVQILLGNGDGTFKSGSTYSALTPYWALTFFGDFHGNGHQDGFLFKGYPPESFMVFTGAGDGTFQTTDPGYPPLNFDAIVPGQFVSHVGLDSLAYISYVTPQEMVGTILPTLAEKATLPPYTFPPDAPATRSVQCSYGGDSHYSPSVSPAVNYVIPDALAALTSPTPNSVLAGPTVTFTWSPALATNYTLWLGTAQGTNNLHNSGATTGLSVTATGLPTNGETIYARLYTNFTSGAQKYFDYTFTAATAAALTSPAPGSVLTGSKVTFHWTIGTGAISYDLRLGTTVGGYDIRGTGAITATSVTFSPLPTNGETIYARLYTIYATTPIPPYTDYTFTAANQTRAAMTSPAPNSTLPGSQVTFQWTAGTGASSYNLRLGTTPGANDIRGPGLIPGTSVTFSPLPTNGETIYARLYTNYAAGSDYTDYVFTAPTQTQAVLISPAPNSTLPSSNVTFHWTPGTGAVSYTLKLGTTVGGNDIRGTTTTSTSINYAPLPTNGETIYVRLYTNYPSGRAYNDYVFTAAP